MVEKKTETKQTTTKVEAEEPVYVRDYRKKVYNTLNNEMFELDNETAEVFAQNPKFYNEVFDPNMNKTVLVSVLRWEGVDGQQVGS